MSKASKLTVNSAIKPLLVACLFLIPFFLIGAFYFKDNIILCIILFIMAIIFSISLLVSYFYLLIKMPEKLQSEDYQIKHQAMKIYEMQHDKICPTEKGMINIANPRNIEK